MVTIRSSTLNSTPFSSIPIKNIITDVKLEGSTHIYMITSLKRMLKAL